MDVNLEITIMDAEEFADLWTLLDEMIVDGDVPQQYRTRIKAIRRMIDKEDTDEQFPDREEDTTQNLRRY